MQFFEATITIKIQADSVEEADKFVEQVKASVPPEVTDDTTPGIYEYFGSQAYPEPD